MTRPSNINASHQTVKGCPAFASKVKGLKGSVDVPGDKSISHRTLILSTLSTGRSTITNLLQAEDVLNTAKIMEALGAHIEPKEEIIEIHGPGIGALLEPEDILDCGNSGTGARLIMGMVAPYDMACFFNGDASLRARPMARVTEPLSEIGAHFITRSKGRLPLALCGAKHSVPIAYRLPVASAQVKSALLLAALSTPGITTITEPTPTRDHTERMLKAAGAHIEISHNEHEERVISIEGLNPLKPQDFYVPSDPSSAAFLIVAVLITQNSELTLKNVMLNPTRTGLFETLIEMGANITITNKKIRNGEEVGDLHVISSALKGVHVPASRAPSMIDEYPILAVAASFAEGETYMEGLEELRVKESDRLHAVQQGLEACQVPHDYGKDWLKIKGGEVKGGGYIQTHMDHRIAMSFLIMGLASQAPITVDDTQMIATSFPNFFDIMHNIGGKLQKGVAPL